MKQLLEVMEMYFIYLSTRCFAKEFFAHVNVDKNSFVSLNQNSCKIGLCNVECTYMTGLLHEGIFHVGGLIKPAIFGSLPWAYVMCN